MSAVTATSSASTHTLRRCCRRACRGAQPFVVGGLVTSTPTEDVRTRTPWTSGSYVITTARVGTLGLPFLSGRSSFSHRERMPPPRGFSERCFPTPSFPITQPPGWSSPGAGIPKENPESPGFWPFAKLASSP